MVSTMVICTYRLYHIVSGAPLHYVTMVTKVKHTLVVETSGDVGCLEGDGTPIL